MLFSIVTTQTFSPWKKLEIEFQHLHKKNHNRNLNIKKTHNFLNYKNNNKKNLENNII